MWRYICIYGGIFVQVEEYLHMWRYICIGRGIFVLAEVYFRQRYICIGGGIFVLPEVYLYRWRYICTQSSSHSSIFIQHRMMTDSHNFVLISLCIKIFFSSVNEMTDSLSKPFCFFPSLPERPLNYNSVKYSFQYQQQIYALCEQTPKIRRIATYFSAVYYAAIIFTNN